MCLVAYFFSYGLAIRKAIAAGEARADVEADDLLNAIAWLCMATNEKKPGQGEQMVALLADGLRCYSILARACEAENQRLPKRWFQQSPLATVAIRGVAEIWKDGLLADFRRSSASS